MAIEIAAASATTTGVGSADGYVSVGDSTPFYPGATVYIDGDEYTIVNIDGNDLGLHKKSPKFGGVVYTRSDCSGIASGAVVSQPRQLVPVSWTGPKAVGPQGGR